MAYDDTSFNGDLIVDEYDDHNNFVGTNTPSGFLVYHLLGDGFDLMAEQCSKFMNDFSILSASASSLDKFWGVSYNMPRPLLYEGQKADYSLIDNGTNSSHTDCWNVSNGTMTRESTYTRLVESTNPLMCQLNSAYITPTSTVEFDFKAIDGVKNYGLVYIRNSNGGNSLADLSLNNVGGDIGEWIHLKIVFNNTSTITIYASTLAEPITKTLSSTDTAYRLLLYCGGANTELHFKNVKVYTGEEKERPLNDDEYRVYLYLRNCRLLTREDLLINMQKCFGLDDYEIVLSDEAFYLEATDHPNYEAEDTISSNLHKRDDDTTLHFVTDYSNDETTEVIESGLSEEGELVTVINIPYNDWDTEFLEMLEQYVSVKGNLKIKEYHL